MLLPQAVKPGLYPGWWRPLLKDLPIKMIKELSSECSFLIACRDQNIKEYNVSLLWDYQGIHMSFNFPKSLASGIYQPICVCLSLKTN